MTIDFNAAFPAPDRAKLDDNSLEAHIQDILGRVAPDGGSWLVGRHVFWESLLNGQLFEPAVRAAIDAAAPLTDAAAADKRYTVVMLAQFGPTEPQGAVAKTRQFFSEAVATFGTRNKPSN